MNRWLAGCAQAPYVVHLLTRPGTRVVVGELDGSVSGVAASIEFGSPDCRFLCDLYVDPAHQSRGLGGALLGGGDGRCEAAHDVPSSDRRALASYIRVGMRPWWPLLYLEVEAGILHGDERGVETHRADIPGAARHSRAWTGIDRTADFTFYASLPDAAGFVVSVDGETRPLVGRAAKLAAPGRWLDHASFAPDADPLQGALGVSWPRGPG